METQENLKRSSPSTLYWIFAGEVASIIMLFVAFWGIVTYPDAWIVWFLVTPLAPSVVLFWLRPAFKKYLDAKQAVAYITVWTDLVDNAHVHGSGTQLCPHEVLGESNGRALLAALFERELDGFVRIMEVVGPKGGKRLQETHWHTRVHNNEPLFADNGSYVEFGRFVDTGASSWNWVFEISAEPFHENPLESYEVLIENTVFGMVQLLACVLLAEGNEGLKQRAILVFLNQLTGYAEEEPEVTLDLLEMARTMLKDQRVPEDHPIFAEINCRVREIEAPTN
ncbi:TPA: hypothetical protein DEB00_01045 [Candidatus Uhrbacteria bacterium]|nr:hypothetical protein [Candidatus Uhrbacteria bacterium]